MDLFAELQIFCGKRGGAQNFVPFDDREKKATFWGVSDHAESIGGTFETVEPLPKVEI